MREAAEKIEMRPAVLVAARPQPDMIGQKERNAAFAFAAKHHQRLVVRSAHYGCAGHRARIDKAEPAAPVRRLLVVVEAARHWMAAAKIGELRQERLLGEFPAGLG